MQSLGIAVLWPWVVSLLFTSEEVEQTAFLHQLGDDPVRRRGRADSKQRDEVTVTVTETLKNLNFPLKLTVVQLRV